MTASGLLISWAAAWARLATCCCSSAWRRASSIRRRSVMSRVKPRVRTKWPSSQRALDEIRTSLIRSEEHTSELQSLAYLVCRLLLEKKQTTDAWIAALAIHHLLPALNRDQTV